MLFRFAYVLRAPLETTGGASRIQIATGPDLHCDEERRGAIFAVAWQGCCRYGLDQPGLEPAEERYQTEKALLRRVRRDFPDAVITPGPQGNEHYIMRRPAHLRGEHPPFIIRSRGPSCVLPSPNLQPQKQAPLFDVFDAPEDWPPPAPPKPTPETSS